MSGPTASLAPCRCGFRTCAPEFTWRWERRILRWRIAVLVSAAIAISYLDRQTLPVAIKAVGRDIPLSNEQFSYLQSAFLLAYAFMYDGGGKLSDALGTRRGFTVIKLFWSLACLSHGL